MYDPRNSVYLQRPLQGLVVRGKLVHFVLVAGVPLDERPNGLYLCPQVQPFFLQPLQEKQQVWLSCLPLVMGVDQGGGRGPLSGGAWEGPGMMGLPHPGSYTIWPSDRPPSQGW